MKPQDYVAIAGHRRAWARALRTKLYQRKRIMGCMHIVSNVGNWTRRLCPLGVACKVLEKRGVPVRYQTGGIREQMVGDLLLGRFRRPPQRAVAEALGLTYLEETYLVCLNDRDRVSYAKIAQRIEDCKANPLLRKCLAQVDSFFSERAIAERRESRLFDAANNEVRRQCLACAGQTSD